MNTNGFRKAENQETIHTEITIIGGQPKRETGFSPRFFEADGSGWRYDKKQPTLTCTISTTNSLT
jgi:hypothetical protein